MKENHFVGVINTGSRRSAYPIKAGNFSNNVIEDIYQTAINCAGRSIINNVIGNIVGYTISNTNLEDNTIKELIGGSSGYVQGEHPNDSTIPTGSQHD
jgi:hypothetical protein